MSLGEKEVRHIAKLSALELSEQEVSKYSTELGNIMEYVDRLASVNTLGVIPTSHVHGVVNYFRDDIIKDSLPFDEVARIAPDFIPGGYRVPKII